MKINDIHFEDYLINEKNAPLHPKLHKVYDLFPKDIKNLRNLIFYGPKGVGKYTQMLRSIVKYSPSELKYDRKINNTCGKSSYILKISDIHFEVDMSLLGCNAKTIWNEIYNHIVDVILARQTSSGIIVCKYFHDIHGDLLESFYSYMQTLHNNSLDIKFILITEQLSFIPDCIVDTCRIIRVARPSRQQYNRCLQINIPKNIKLSEITNMKNIVASPRQLLCSHELLCNEIINMILDPINLKYNDLRDRLYDLLIYNLDVTECIWYILQTLIILNRIQEVQSAHILLQTYRCLKYYNNNYRPIYHLESFIFYLINTIHGFT